MFSHILTLFNKSISWSIKENLSNFYFSNIVFPYKFIKYLRSYD